MAKNKKVTIAIPFFNSEKYLEYAILSVLNQTYKDFELILINDGGTDSSIAIAEKYALIDSRIKVINDGLNKGLPVRLNETIRLAKGEYYARMDDDDIMVCNRIAEQVRYLEEHPDVDVVGSSAIVIDGDNKIKLSIDQHGATTGFLHPTVTGRTLWFLNNPYDEKYRRSQDFELWLRTAHKSKFYNMQRPFLFYREVESVSLKKSLISHKILRGLYRNYQYYDKTLMWCVKNTAISYIKDLACIIVSLFTDSNMLRNQRRKQLPQYLMLDCNDIKQAIVEHSGGGVILRCIFLSINKICRFEHSEVINKSCNTRVPSVPVLC